ncbi:barrier-to-autointegration factor-like [Coturnix japonica]|uniref:barrier-to-autointegration factor-like n=1 Tax=Coturnix japonica TaxID=93934 RepID=UPI000777289F|nr:barrier-to-autointegration factor-like [Coturnix japonica]
MGDNGLRDTMETLWGHFRAYVVLGQFLVLKKDEELGHFRAYVVLGQFLVLKKDEELFREWLRDACGANAKQSRDCSGCLREWCDAFL